MSDFEKYLIEPTATILDAWRQIDQNSGSVLFVAENKVLQGSLTDGDLRRFMLNGGTLDSVVSLAMKANPYKVLNRLDKLDADFKSAPLVDGNGVILDILTKGGTHSYNSTSLKNTPVVITAGGSGTRLKPYTNILPKPLLPIGSVPIIDIILSTFSEFGAKEIFMIVNYKKEIIKAYFAESELEVKFMDESRPLGTGGGLYMLKDILKGSFFFSNCDTVIKADYEDILKHHKKRKNDITIVVAVKGIAVPYGVIKITEEGAINGFEEKPKISNFINTGFYLVEPDVLKYINEDESVGFPDIAMRVIENGGRVGAYPISEESFLDMGIPEEMERMRRLMGVEEE